MATSSEAKYRWIKKAYKQYTVSLRYDTEKDLIDLVEGMKSTGKGNREVFIKALELLQKEVEK